MKKMEVNRIAYTGGLTLIQLKRSHIGEDKPIKHPLTGCHRSTYSSRVLAGIKIGDVLRCDGLPFMSRPTPIIKTNENGRKPLIYSRTNGKFIHHYTHNPYKLESGYWVLRPNAELK